MRERELADVLLRGVCWWAPIGFYLDPSPAGKVYRAHREALLLLSLSVLTTLITNITNRTNSSFEISLLILYEDLLLRFARAWKPLFFFVCIICALFLNNKSP